MTEDKGTFLTKEIIETIRWLHTAVNRRDYAIVFNGHIAHVFCGGSSVCYSCDRGIAMAHLEVACIACGLDGLLEKLENVGENILSNWKYLDLFVYK